jgi:alcohol dehydrogenase (cytochrome c)
LTNWAKGLNKSGAPQHDPQKDATVPGSLVSPTSDGTINWEPPAFSPDTGLFYTAEGDGYSIFYLTDVDPCGSMGLGGKEEAGVGSGGSFLTAIDHQTGKVAWRHPFYGNGGGGGLLTTAGKLLFSADGAGSLLAYDAATGETIVEYPHPKCHKCSSNLHAGWPPVPAGGDGRYALVSYV